MAGGHWSMAERFHLIQKHKAESKALSMAWTLETSKPTPSDLLQQDHLLLIPEQFHQPGTNKHELMGAICIQTSTFYSLAPVGL